MAIATGTTASHPCLKLQEDISRYYAKNPAAEQFSTGTLDALLSAQNRTGTMMLTEGDGARPTATSNRKIQVRYVPKTCEEGGVSWSECSYGTPQAPLYKTADIRVDRSVEWGFDLPESTFRDICETQDDGYIAFFNAKYADAKKRLNNLAVVDVVGAMGAYPVSGNNSVTTPITVPVVTAAGAFNPAGFGLIGANYKQMNQIQEPILVGAGKLDLATTALKYSGVADTGLDGSKGAFSYFRDPFINSDYFNDGDDHLLTWQPGSILLAEWHEFVGMYDKTYYFNIDGQQKVEKSLTTIVTPDGLKWDTLYVYDCGTHKFRFRKWIGVAPLPSDAFGTCQDYNYALHYLLGCGSLTCENINSLVGAPAQSS